MTTIVVSRKTSGLAAAPSTRCLSARGTSPISDSSGILEFMARLDRLSEFHQQHNLGARSVCVHHLTDGELWFAHRSDDVWAISWYPYRSDHPDAPYLVTDTAREKVDATGDADTVGERLTEHFSGRDPRSLFSVTIEQEASREELQTVQRVFDNAGVPAIVSANYGRHSAIHTSWVVIISGAFISGFVAKGGADAFDTMREFIQNLYRERRSLGYQEGGVQLDEGRRRIELNETVPLEAYRALAELGDEGLYHWDRNAREWRRL
jgi:hypothetical protein